MIDLDELLKDDNFLEQIIYPTKNQKIKEEFPKGTYIFENNEQFKGRMKNNKLSIGIYKWPNGQQYLGDLSDNNNFTKRGTIIFPSNNKLIGNFIMKEKKIKSAVYETADRKYEGSFVNNKFEGRFIIKNKEATPHYFFQGAYHLGLRHGNFILEKLIRNKIILITGVFNKGKKDGLFHVYIKKSEKEKILIYKKNFKNDHIVYEYPDEEKIENKNILIDYELPHKICCFIIIKSLLNKIYIMIGSYENLFILDIFNNTTPYPVQIFKKADINDIVQTKDGKFLLCSSENNFKLIEPFPLECEEEKLNASESRLETSYTNKNDIVVIQEFKGLKNSKNIFVMKELSNELIVSGDSENLILWEKEGKNDLNEFYEYKYITHINLTHTYSIVEIKKENKKNNENIILSVAQPDTKCLLIFNIDKNKNINLIKKICNINTIHNRKNIMKQLMDKAQNILFVGCQDKIVIINLINYEIIYNIFFEKITYINIYLNKYILCGIIKNKNEYNCEGYLSQVKLEAESRESKNIRVATVSNYIKSKHNGNIIDGDIIIVNNKEMIITIGNDNKILVLYN